MEISVMGRRSLHSGYGAPRKSGVDTIQIA